MLLHQNLVIEEAIALFQRWFFRAIAYADVCHSTPEILSTLGYGLKN
ncbi:hypothetical protein N0Y54_20935 [Nostoc punctiforme UO1]